MYKIVIGAILSLCIILIVIGYCELRIATYKFIFCDDGLEIAYLVSFVRNFTDTNRRLPSEEELRRDQSVLPVLKADSDEIVVAFGPRQGCTLRILLDKDKVLHFSAVNGPPH